jgi:gliding motility-associated-like protein
MVRDDVQADISAVNNICENNVVVFNDNSIVPVGTTFSSVWDFGDGSAQSTSVNTTHIYNTPGTYFITHIVISDGGCASTTLDTVNVHAVPVAMLSAANTCQDQPSVFTDNSTGNPNTWSWNFGDGGTSAAQNPVHPYLSAGTYPVTLIVTTNFGCSDTAVRSIVVYPQPLASFSSDVVCWGDTTTFINTSSTSSGSISSSWWSFGDGDTSNVSHPQHEYLIVNDTFNVTLAVVTNHGCVDTVVQQVITNPIPEFIYSPMLSSGCDAFTTSFNESSTVSGGTIVNWLWDFGDGNLTYTQNPTHTYDSSGNFYVSLTVTSSYGCLMSDTLSYPVVVYPKPMAGFSASPNETTIYEPIIQFINESSGATMWDWDLGDFETSILYEPEHIYPDTGTFVATQIAINQYGCRDTTSRIIRINGVTTTFIPNAFTPDGNSLNDIFSPKFYGIVEFKMLIFDRWGNEIFMTEDMNEGWNGKMKGTGTEVQQDVYVYKILTKDLLRNKHEYVGRVTVVR